MNPDPLVLLRSRGYVRLLVLAALIGVPVSAAAYGFLELVTWLEDQLFTELPDTLGFASTPAWWPLPLLVISGFLTAMAIRRLPGTGGSAPEVLKPSDGGWPPVPGSRLIASAVSNPEITSSGSGHHAGVDAKPSASGSSLKSWSCSHETSSRKPYDAADTGMPIRAASTSSRT